MDPFAPDAESTVRFAGRTIVAEAVMGLGSSRSLALGAVAGATILGAAGRLATAALAVGLGRPANLSLRGMAESIVVGAAIGAVGGALLPVVERLGAIRGMRPGMVTAILLLAISVGVALVAERPLNLFEPPGLATAGVVALAFVAYGVALDRSAAAPRSRR